MKYLKAFFYSSIILGSCQTATPPPNKRDNGKIEDFKKKIVPIINGYWVEPTYIQDISKTRSPNKSRNSLASIIELDIDTTEIAGDSIEIAAPGIHEGTSFIAYFKMGKEENSLPTNIPDYDRQTNFYELGYSITKQDTILIIYHYDKKQNLLGETKYLKIPKNSENALQYTVNKILFTGSYKTSDSNGQPMTIQFTNDGMVKGFPNFKKYYVLTDFVAEPETKLDEVYFDIHTKNQTCYAYEIKGDTINLYVTHENEHNLQLGQLKYVLIKQ